MAKSTLVATNVLAVVSDSCATATQAVCLLQRCRVVTTLTGEAFRKVRAQVLQLCTGATVLAVPVVSITSLQGIFLRIEAVLMGDTEQQLWSPKYNGYLEVHG